ncbi:hypothetical protein LTR49_023821 [Elasticomyces elasticus]|nr:hypothetical protein LTR49_023821 [Elasticomyces elasticus]
MAPVPLRESFRRHLTMFSAGSFMKCWDLQLLRFDWQIPSTFITASSTARLVSNAVTGYGTIRWIRIPEALALSPLALMSRNSRPARPLRIEMRLIHTRDYTRKRFGSPPAKYAVLSHRWYADEKEVDYQKFSSEDLTDKTQETDGLNKIRNACIKADEAELDWLWIDSCCIDKTSSTELNESLRSMFRWYRQATICLTYLADVKVSESLPTTFRLLKPVKRDDDSIRTNSEWFERGWTLQELLAPTHMMFYDKQWKKIGTKKDLVEDLEKITSISESYILNPDTIRAASVAMKLSWARDRMTTQEEDRVYSMIGIFDVSLLVDYGEGEATAFRRLQESILHDSRDESIFAWTSLTSNMMQPPGWGSAEWGLLAPSIDCFRDSGDITVDGRSSPRQNPGVSMMPNRIGVQFPVPAADFHGIKHMSTIRLIPYVGDINEHITRVRAYRDGFGLTLNCWRRDPHSNQPKAVQVWVKRSSGSDAKSSLWRRQDISRLRLAESEAVPESKKRTKYGSKAVGGVSAMLLTIELPE